LKPQKFFPVAPQPDSVASIIKAVSLSLVSDLSSLKKLSETAAPVAEWTGSTTKAATGELLTL